MSALNAVGEGGRSNERSATPAAAATVPGAPTPHQRHAGNGERQPRLERARQRRQRDHRLPGLSRHEPRRRRRCSRRSATATSWTDSGLTNGTTYYYKVSALNAVGEGGRSNERSATPAAAATVPGAPGLTSATPGNGERQPRLERARRRRLRDHRLPGLPRHEPRRRDAAHDARQRHELDRQRGSPTARPTTTRSAPSTRSARAPAPTSARPRPPPPPPCPAHPASTSATPATAASASPGARPSNGGCAITGYRVYRGTSAGGETLLTTLGTVTSWTDTGLTNGTTYYYKVSAVNAVGEGALSNERSATPAAAATVPGAPTPHQRHAPATAASPRLERARPTAAPRSPATGSTAARARRRRRCSRRSAPARAATDTALTNGTTYYYKVSALNAVGEGGPPTSAPPRPPPPPPCPAHPALNQRHRRQRQRQPSPGAPRPTAAPRSPATGSTAARARRRRRCSRRSAPARAGPTRRSPTAPPTTTRSSAVNAVGEGAGPTSARATPGRRRHRARRTQRSTTATPATAASPSPGARPADGGSRDHRLPGLPRHEPRHADAAHDPRQRHELDRQGRLTNGTTYYYKVSALNAVGEGGRSNERSATPLVVKTP